MREQIWSKLEQLKNKIQNLKEENFEYQEKIANFEQILKEQSVLLQQYQNENEELKSKLEQFAIGKAFAGNAEGNKEAKAKIDSLIKEINLCIATLKE